MTTNRTREAQYQVCLDRADEGVTSLGLMSNQVWQDDPRRMVFLLSRYKFVAKLLAGRAHALEVGCADGFGARIVRQEVPAVTAVDFDPIFIEDAQRHVSPRWPITFRVHDLLQGPVPGTFDAAYSLDVIEHIPLEQEDLFVGNVARSLSPDGVFIVGSPSLESQAYASPPSRAGHVNCKDGPGMRALMQRFFRNVFLFSMNDEVVHTGFTPMAHYLIALCVGPAQAP